MHAVTPDHETEPVVGLRGVAAMFLASAVAFFPMIMNPLIFGFFDDGSEAERLEHVEEHLGGLRLLFTGIGLAEVALGAALWLWGRHVAERTPGRRGDVANGFAWVGIAAGLIAFLTRLTAWTDDAAALASDDLDAVDIIFGVVAGGGFSLAFLVFGYLMIRGSMPTWLGVMWIICGVMYWLGILPLWFFFAGLVFGIRGVIRFRAGSPAIDRISASPPDRTTSETTPRLEVQ